VFEQIINCNVNREMKCAIISQESIYILDEILTRMRKWYEIN